MAFEVQQINPLDLRDSLGIGVKLPFSGRAVFNVSYTTKEAIKSNLINYFLTNKGERFLNPNFGSNIRSLLFENITQDSILSLKGIITRELAVYFPNVKPTTFEINGDPDSYTATVFFKYQVLNTNIEDEILINIEQ